MIHPEKKKYIDRTSAQMITSLVEKVEKKKDYEVAIGSVKEKKIHKIDRIIGDFEFSTTNHRNEKIDQWTNNGNNTVGINQETYPSFKKFIDNICKDRYVSNIASKDFVEMEVFRWLARSYREKQAPNNLSDQLELVLKLSIEKFRFCFSVLNLEIESELKIGDVTLKYIRKADIQHIKELLEKNNQKGSYQRFEDDLAGKVVIECFVEGEYKKAKEIAYEKCCRAMDVLMICSHTAYAPELKLNFDIDSRLSVPGESDYLVFKENNEISRSMENIGNRHIFDRRYRDALKERGFSLLVEFITRYDPQNELYRLLINSINAFSRALLLSDFSKRIAELFSILESLILPLDDAPILDSLSKYVPKLITKDPQQRRAVIKVLKNLYRVRSKKIHHGIDSEVDLEELRLLQLILCGLIQNLIVKNQTHESKVSVLKEIDDILNEAY